jgi:hypothetical protein
MVRMLASQFCWFIELDADFCSGGQQDGRDLMERREGVAARRTDEYMEGRII